MAFLFQWDISNYKQWIYPVFIQCLTHNQHFTSVKLYKAAGRYTSVYLHVDMLTGLHLRFIWADKFKSIVFSHSTSSKSDD